MPSELAPAKINLALHVRAREPDGYHRIETVFAFAADGDWLEAEPSEELSLSIDGPFASDLVSDDDNLVLRAARALQAASGTAAGAAMRLTKTLPVASGIGGGSADAAATLRLLSGLWATKVPLEAIARALGADVPACLLGKAAFGTGRGEVLTPLSLASRSLFLINPRVAVSTGPVFAAWDGVDRGALEDWTTGRNDLETPAISLCPEIAPLLDWLRAQPGVPLARMSGSGATCFALLDTERDLVALDEAAARDWPAHWRLATRIAC